MLQSLHFEVTVGVSNCCNMVFSFTSMERITLEEVALNIQSMSHIWPRLPVG